MDHRALRLDQLADHAVAAASAAGPREVLQVEEDAGFEH
jgi:hypothetical protein